MQFLTLTLTVLTSLLISSSRGITMSHDKVYNDGSAPLDNVACSDGSNGLVTRGFETFGSIPNFPYIGGAYTVEGWNSPKCGACYNLTYTNAQKQNKAVYITAVDHTIPGFNIAESAFVELVGSANAGKVEVNAQEVYTSFCGFK